MQLSPKSMVGKTFDDRYELLELLGTGAFGSVFKARQLDADRLVAIKVFELVEEPDEIFKERVIREALSLGKLKHLNIVSIYHAGVNSSFAPYLVMEYVSGVSVRQLIVERRLNYVRSLKIVRDLANAMEFAHREGVIHRDLKPENFVLLDEPEPDTIKILDFGLAKLQEEREIKLTKTGFLVGTVNYMSPEQCTGQRIDHRSDIYSLGICLFEMITGEVPYNADTPVGIIYKHINDALPELKIAMGKNQNRLLNEILQGATAKLADKRFQSMSEFSAAIEVLLNQIGDDTASIDIERSKSRKDNRKILGAVAVLVFMAISGVVWYQFQRATFKRTFREEALTTQVKPKNVLDAQRARSKYLYSRLQSSIRSCESLLAQKELEAAGGELAAAIRSLLTSLHNTIPDDSEASSKLYLCSEKIAELASKVKIADSYGLEIALRTMAYDRKKYSYPVQIAANLYLISARLADTAGETVDCVRYFADAANCRLLCDEIDLAQKMLDEAEKVKVVDKHERLECQNKILLVRSQIFSTMKLKPQAIEAARLAAKQWIAMPSMNISRRAQEMRSLATVLRALGDDATASALEQRLAMEAAGTGGIDTLISEEAMMEKIENRKSP